MIPAPTHRPPINIALVLDKSGSMSGHKLEQAKLAAIQSLDRLDTRDIVSVVAYDSTVQVVVPATRLTDKAMFRSAIHSIQAGGNTALFAGVSKAAAEVRKFLDRNRVSRVILLSDGLANVGPSAPADLAQLGRSLMKEGIAVSTLGLGLGYNEDLMFELARHSDGNHVFVEEATDLTAVFKREFGDVLSVVAQEIAITIRCAPGVRPVRLLGVDGDINGQNVVVQLNQLYSAEEKYILLEIEVPGVAEPVSRPVADVEVTYANMQTRITDRLNGSVAVQFDASSEAVKNSVNVPVMTEAVLQIANIENERAVVLRDAGKITEAQSVLDGNDAFLMINAVEFESEELKERALDNRSQAGQLDDTAWNKTRKGMRDKQYQDRSGRLQKPTHKEDGSE